MDVVDVRLLLQPHTTLITGVSPMSPGSLSEWLMIGPGLITICQTHV